MNSLYKGGGTACLLSLPVCPAQNFLMQVDLRLQKKPKRPRDVFDLRMNVHGTHLLHLQTNMIKYSSCIFILQCVSGLVLTPSYINHNEKSVQKRQQTLNTHTQSMEVSPASALHIEKSLSPRPWALMHSATSDQWANICAAPNAGKSSPSRCLLAAMHAYQYLMSFSQLNLWILVIYDICICSKDLGGITTSVDKNFNSDLSETKFPVRLHHDLKSWEAWGCCW